MVQHLHSAIRSLKTARSGLSAEGLDTSYLDWQIQGLEAYAKGISPDDPYLPAVVLFLTQRKGYSGHVTNPELQRRLGMESTEEMQAVLDPYVGQGILKRHGITHGSGKTNVFYQLSDVGYELSINALRERAEKDKRAPSDINTTEVGLSPAPLGHLARNGITNLGQLFSRGIPYMPNTKARKEIVDKTAFYSERTQRS